MSKYLTTIFCDDVRKEEGNKYSYMGVYLGSLIVPMFPIVLPRLCFAMTMTIPTDSPASELRFRVYKDDEIVAEAEVPAAVLEAVRSAPVDPAEEQMLRIGTILNLFPVQLNEKCSFRARASCDGKEYKGGSLLVEQYTDVPVAFGAPGVLTPFNPVPKA